jgi:hypothetical protein
MKNNSCWNRLSVVAFIICAFAVSVTARQYGDFIYTDNGADITITGYTASGGPVTIPGTIDGKPTSIGGQAFVDCSGLNSIARNDNAINLSVAYGGVL